MCSPSQGSMMLPYGIKVASGPYLSFGGNSSQMALELQRAQQLYDFGTRMQYGIRGYPNTMGLTSYQSHPVMDHYLQHYLFKDPRIRYLHEEPKPNHSYIGLIAMAILSSRDKKLVLSEIYQWILDNYPYFRTRGPGWRNSIRHNLSLNDCFIKSGRSANGKGHYWAIHPANIDDFQKGDFRRRRAQRRVRRHMGLAVPDDDDSPAPSPTAANWSENENIDIEGDQDVSNSNDSDKVTSTETSISDTFSSVTDQNICIESGKMPTDTTTITNRFHSYEVTAKCRKRNFDMESLLAPDDEVKTAKFENEIPCQSEQYADDIDVGKETSANIICNEGNSEKESVLDLSTQKDLNRNEDLPSNIVNEVDPRISTEIDGMLLLGSGIRNYGTNSLSKSAFHHANAPSWNSKNQCFSALSANVHKIGIPHPFLLTNTLPEFDESPKAAHRQFLLRTPTERTERGDKQ